MDVTEKYGKNYRPELEKADQSNLFGMCYISRTMFEGNNIDFRKGYRILKNMGVRSIRHWQHFQEVMSDYKTIDRKKADLMHEILAEANSYGFQMIGMCHCNWNLEAQKFVTAKIPYDPTEGSVYRKWIETYEESWYTMVKEFPEITYWEIDNEINNYDFMCVYGAPKGADGRNLQLPLKEMAQISADMLFYGSRGIHRANPDAITVLGGLTDPHGLGNPTVAHAFHNPEEKISNDPNPEFLELLYDCIESGEHGSKFPDDFFQVACWHPYYWYPSAPGEAFVAENNRTYEVIKRREGKDKKVFLSEFGWNEKFAKDADKIAEWIPMLYELIRKEMPYVESLHYFRMFDNLKSKETFGLFHDCFQDLNYDDFDWLAEVGPHGSPRKSAYAYQKAAGGFGPLDLLVEKK